MNQYWRWIFGLLGLFILLPMSHDFLKLSVSHYDIRVNYLAVFAVVCLGALLAFLSDSFRKEILPKVKDYLRPPSIVCFILFLISGLISVYVSYYFTRSFMIWVWTAGTLMTVPFVVKFYHESFPKMTPTLTLYLCFQSLIILFHPLFRSLGMKEYSLSFASGDRPQAFYAEPNYFVVFALLMMVLMRWKLMSVGDKGWKTFYGVAFGLTVFAILVTDSTSGYVGLMAFFGLEVLRFVYLKSFYKGWRVGFLCAGGAGVVSVMVLLFSFHARDFVCDVAHYAWNKTSFKDRFLTSQAAGEAFLSAPVFGVGPGAGRAFIADQGGDHWYRSMHKYKGKEKQEFRNAPLSYDLFMEVLSEWGGLGFLLLFLGLVLFFMNVPLVLKGYLLVMVPVVMVTWQSLPRFDLWVVLSFLSLMGDD